MMPRTRIEDDLFLNVTFVRAMTSAAGLTNGTSSTGMLCGSELHYDIMAQQKLELRYLGESQTAHIPQLKFRTQGHGFTNIISKTTSKATNNPQWHLPSNVLPTRSMVRLTLEVEVPIASTVQRLKLYPLALA